MHAWIYKGSRKANTYLFIAEKDNFETVPDGLLTLLGNLEFVLSVELTEGRKLARADAREVRSQLEHQGFYLQLPPAEETGGRPC